MKFQLAVATISTTVGLSAFDVEAKKVAPKLAQRQVQLVDAIKKLDVNSRTRSRHVAFQNSRGHRKLLKSKSGQFLSNDRENESQNLDLGVLDYSDDEMDTMQNNERTINRRLDDVLEEGAALVDYLEAVIAAPLGYNLKYYCDEYGDACNTCGTFPVYDPVTSKPTGAYNVELDCPGAGANADLFEDLSLFCDGEYFCDGCEPLCESCSVDKDNFVVSNQNCILTEQLKAALEVDDLENTLATLLAALARYQELVSTIDYLQGISARPFGSILDNYCEQYGDICNICGTFPVNDPVTGEPTGAYNLEMDCPSANLTYFRGGIFQNACNGEYFCEGCEPLCESCILDQTNIFVSNENCLLTEEQRVGLGLDQNDKRLADLIAAKDALVAAISKESASFAEEQNESQGGPIVELPEEEDVQEPQKPTVDTPAVEEPSVDEPVAEETVPAEPTVEAPETEEEGSSTTESKAKSTRVNILVSTLLAGASVLWMAL